MASGGCQPADAEQELSVLCPRGLQAALVYIGTLMVQDILAGEDWASALSNADRRSATRTGAA